MNIPTRRRRNLNRFPLAHAVALLTAFLDPPAAAERFTPSPSVADYRSVHDAVAQNPGRRLHLPSGRHILTNALVLHADHTEIEGPGTLVQSNPDAAIIEARAHHVHLRDLTLTPTPGETDTDRDAVFARDSEFFRAENLHIHDNHSRGASIRLNDNRGASVNQCPINNYIFISLIRIGCTGSRRSVV